jgi:cyclopropane fatty-acyl-phospholipid synthase-like methyltransferase
MRHARTRAVNHGKAAATTGGDPSDAHVELLRAYYEDSWFDYRFLWLDPRTRAMHFGYDDGRGRKHADALIALNEVMAARAGLARGDRVLDAGCGVGGTSFWLTEEWDADVVGVNLVADHVDRARRYTSERNLGDRPRFEVRDYCNTGFEPDSFDVVWATESACHAPVKADFVAEAMRLLRPGGRLVMAEYVPFPADPPHPAITRWEEAWEMTLATAETWSDAFADAGFTDVEIEDITSHVRASLRRLRRLCLLLGPIARGLHLVRLRTDAQQRNIAGSNAMWEALQAGAWFYAIMVATKPVA